MCTIIIWHKVKTGERHPLKQGLKRISIDSGCIVDRNWRKTSTKTRIETPEYAPLLYGTKTGERHPLKQGLKRSIGSMSPSLDICTGERHPLKQGLKPPYAGQYVRIWLDWRKTSTKTRIETFVLHNLTKTFKLLEKDIH